MGGDREWSAIGVIFPYEPPTSHFASDLHPDCSRQVVRAVARARLQSARKDGHGEGLQALVGGCEMAVRRVVSYRARTGSGVGNLTVRYHICGGSNSISSIAIPLFSWVQ